MCGLGCGEAGVNGGSVDGKSSEKRARVSGHVPGRVPRPQVVETAAAIPDLDALLVAHCRHAATELPAGKSGVRWAADFLAVLPVACRRRLPDVVASGPKIFEFLVGQGLFATMPSPRLVPQVLGLVTSVSPLLCARSSRQWALWLARVHDAGSPVVAAIREQTPPGQLMVTVPAPPSGPPRRAAMLLAERDRLLTELEVAADASERQRVELVALRDERDRLTADLAAATREGERRYSELAAIHAATLSSLQNERGRLAAVVAAAAADSEQIRRQLQAASEAAGVQAGERDRLTAKLAAERSDNERLRAEQALVGKKIAAVRDLSTQQQQGVEQRIAELELQVKKFAAFRQRAMETSTEIRRVLEVDEGDPRNDALLVAEVEAAYRQAEAEAEELQRENAVLRAELENFQTRCQELEVDLQKRSDPGTLGARAERAERTLLRVRDELTAARQETQVLVGRLDAKRNLLHSLQKMMEAQELELASANAELAQRQQGITSHFQILFARERAARLARAAQAKRAPFDTD